MVTQMESTPNTLVLQFNIAADAPIGVQYLSIRTPTGKASGKPLTNTRPSASSVAAWTVLRMFNVTREFSDEARFQLFLVPDGDRERAVDLLMVDDAEEAAQFIRAYLANRT